MGGEVTPRSDLYSLGAMLYEMVTGRPPFLGDDSVAIIGQHINTPPVAPTWHNSECPRQLEALILRLLAKNPNERPASAADVLAALDAMDLTATSDDSIVEAQLLDSLDSRPIRRHALLFVASAPQHLSTPKSRVGGQLLGRPGLADARLTN